MPLPIIYNKVGICLYTSCVGLSALLGLDGQGNAKTFKAWDRAIGLAPRLLYVCTNKPKSINKACRWSWGQTEKICMKRFLLFYLLLFPLVMLAQRQRNYVYLFDCTKSMRDRNGIWDKAKSFLNEDISQLDGNANVTVVLFHQETAQPIRFKAKDFDWKNLERQCDDMLERSIETGICNAWDLGLKYIDNKRNNYLYLFTDGTETVNTQKTDAVCQRIQNWCNQAPNNYAFLVALGEEMKKSPDVRKLIDATKTCDRAFFISDHMGPFGAFNKTAFVQNSHYPKNIKCGFSDYGTFNASVECDDDFYEISLKGNKIANGKAEFIVKQRKQPSSNYQIHFKVISKEEDLHICNPDLFVHIDTRELANLDLAQPSGATEGQYDAGEAKTYPSFLFWKGKEKDVLKADLSAVFNEQAKKKNCSLIISLEVPMELKDRCSLTHNGEKVDKSFVINATDKESIIGIEVPHELAQRDFVIKIKGVSNNLETINAEEGKTYESSIYFEHDVVWNPLKVILMWMGICLLATFIMWMLVLRQYIYPQFKTVVKQFIIPGQAPLVINMRGKRMVVISNNSQHDSLFGEFVKGPVLYKTHPAFHTPIKLLPRKKGILVKTDYTKYRVSVNPIPIVGGVCEITDIINNLKITVQ